MQSKRTVLVLGLVLLLSVQLVSMMSAQEKPPAKDEPVIVLDTTGFWRLHHTLSPPVVEDGRLVPYESEPKWLNRETASPPADWRDLEFDDGTWLRGLARTSCRTPYLARLCIRGRFKVADPAKVKGLRLSVDYHGGVIVHVNGKEVGRSDMPPGQVSKATLAKSYPLETFVAQNGDLLAAQSTYLPGHKRTGPPSAESTRRMGLRDRKLDNLVISSRMLRKGTNILAIEIVRAPFHKVLLQKTEEVGKQRHNRYDWNTCELLSVRLTSNASDAVAPNATRPEGLQVWNSNLLAGDCDTDFGDPGEPLRPISLAGPRNGSFSGKVVVGSTKAIAGLRVTPGDLKGDGGTIPASAIRLRYGLPWGAEQGLTARGEVHQPPYPRSAQLLGLLSESAPAEIPVCKKEAGNRWQEGIRPVPVSGAVAPVWVTVKVPKEAKAGTYSGHLTIEADGEKAVVVPLQLEVVDWTLPDPQKFRTWVELMQSPDTLAAEYEVDLWSEEHWNLIGRSMKLLGEVGSGAVYVPLLAQTNLGNAESMVRWEEKGSGRFQYDFSIMDKYLDLTEKHMGKPKIVVFNVWDVYLIPDEGGPKRGGHGRMVRDMEGRKQQRGMGPLVTTLDPASGNSRNAELPTYFDPRSKAPWLSLFAQLRQRMKKRGLEKAMMIGMVTDAYPTKEEVQLFGEIAPGIPWVSHGHGGFSPNQLLQGVAKVGYQACVWHTKFADGVQTHGKTWPTESLHGWQQSQLTVAFERNGGLTSYPLTRWRQMGEMNITGGQRGMGRIAGDFWPIIKDSRGGRRGIVSERYPNSQWMNLNICNEVLAPGADGAAATDRFEALREGLQECEARIFIERALVDEQLKRRLGAALAKRCRETLDERLLIMWQSLSNLQLGGTMFFGATSWRWSPGVAGHRWFLGSGYQKRSQELYELAGRVAEKLGRK